MTNSVASLHTLEQLTTFVKSALCERDALDPAQTPCFRTPVVRNGRPWGYSFYVEGPRLLKSSAMWAADAGSIVFYDSTGTKVAEVTLAEAPVLPDIRAANNDHAGRTARLKRKSA